MKIYFLNKQTFSLLIFCHLLFFNLFFIILIDFEFLYLFFFIYEKQVFCIPNCKTWRWQHHAAGSEKLLIPGGKMGGAKYRAILRGNAEQNNNLQ